MPLREAIQTWPAQDLSAAVQNLPPDSATHRSELGDMWDWNHLAANMATMVDLLAYWLQAEYAKWIHDPDDPEVKREQARRKREKIKPPPIPLVPPIAHRPPSVAEKYVADYLMQVSTYGADQPIDRTPGKRRIGSDEFDRIIELL